MVKLANLEELRRAKQGYPVGLQQRNRPDVYDSIRAGEARSDWQECPPGITASERSPTPCTRVVEVPGKAPGTRVFVGHSEEGEQYERSLQQLEMQRTRQTLEVIRARVEQGELKEPEKIGVAAARALQAHHGNRYFARELRGGQPHYFEPPLNLRREPALKDKYVIQTEEPHLSAVEAVPAYKELNEVKRGFAHLKGWLEVRPIYHHRPRRVEAHMFVAVLAVCWTGRWRRNYAPRAVCFPHRLPGGRWRRCAVWTCNWISIASSVSVGGALMPPKC